MLMTGGTARRLVLRSQARPGTFSSSSDRHKSIAPPLSVRQVEDRLPSHLSNKRKDELDLCFEVGKRKKNINLYTILSPDY